MLTEKDVKDLEMGWVWAAETQPKPSFGIDPNTVGKDPFREHRTFVGNAHRNFKLPSPETLSEIYLAPQTSWRSERKKDNYDRRNIQADVEDLLISDAFKQIINQVKRREKKGMLSIGDICIDDKTFDVFIKWYKEDEFTFSDEVRLVIKCSDDRLLYATWESDYRDKVEIYVPYEEALYLVIGLNDASFENRDFWITPYFDYETKASYLVEELCTFSKKELKAIAKVIREYCKNPAKKSEEA